MNSKEKNFIYSPYPDMELPHPSIGVTEMLWKRMENWLEATAYVCGITGESYTYRQMKELSCNFAGSLLKSGLRPGDLIGFVSPLSPIAVIAVLGIWQAGCVFTPLNHLYTQDELLRDITKLGFKYMVCTADIFQVLESVIRNNVPHLKNFILLDSSMKADSLGNQIWFYEDLIKVSTSSEDEIFSHRFNYDENSLAIISSSSGSTGLPKSVMLTHYGLSFSTKQYWYHEIVNIKSFKNGQEVTISIYPLSHASGYISCLLALMYKGMKIIVMDKFQPTLFKEVFLKYRPTFLPIVAPVLKFIVESPMFSSKDLKSLRTIATGSAPVTKCLFDAFIKKVNKDICFLNVYASTECLWTTASNSSFENTKLVLGSVGKLYPNTVAKLVDVETGECLGPHKHGEVRVKCPSFMKGYFNDEKATNEAFDEDGFYRTGDIAYYDEDECFYIADRTKDMIKVKGFQVLPKEIESVIQTNSKVNDVAVIGIPHERFGEVPRAYIVKNDETLQAEEIRLLVKEKLAPFKQLEGGIEFIKEIPKIGVGKPGKRLLRDLYINNKP